MEWKISLKYGDIFELHRGFLIFGIILYSILEDNSPKYKIVYGISCLMSVISLGMGLYETDDKFDYDN